MLYHDSYCTCENCPGNNFPLELLPAGSLYGLLHAPGLQLSWRHIVHLALGAARGMAHLHTCLILHRDLKSGV